jgi:hypothetical protein
VLFLGFVANDTANLRVRRLLCRVEKSIGVPGSAFVDPRQLDPDVIQLFFGHAPAVEVDDRQ